MATAGPFIAAALAAVGTGVSIVQTRKAAKSEEDARAISQRQADIANQRQIRQAIEQSRVARAATLASGQAQTGGFGSSGIQGGVGAAQSQLASNIGFANTVNASNQAINDSLSKQANAQANAAIGGSVANLGPAFGFTLKDAFREATAKTPPTSNARATQFGGPIV